ncbi:hypothetical protein ARMGADRAFT_1086963 [Armillaria gallica]|uniref:Uncharacterized protein n=1 Tax=Armillaria gallica TaxID=47427 RepID=A0A2H3CS78_ARMGA|nr:hypothetical protein ARMGADRAFT_1086963 [Armillaria gallica]
MVGDPPTRQNILLHLSSFFDDRPLDDSFNDTLRDPEVGVLCTIIHKQSKFPLLVPQTEHALNRCSHLWKKDLYLLQFKAIVSYIASDSVSSSHEWESIAQVIVCMASIIHRALRDTIDLPPADWDKKSLFLNIRQVIEDHRLYCIFDLYAIEVSGPPISQQHFRSIIGVAGYISGQALSRGILQAYEAFRGSDHLHYFVQDTQLQLELTQGLHAYITGISEASNKMGKRPDIESDEVLEGHIGDLHQTSVVGAICASLVYSHTTARPILSSLVSIAPHHTQWSQILKILNSPGHEYSIEQYKFGPSDTVTNRKHFKKDLKKNVSILADCLMAEMDHRNGINWLSRIFNHQIGSQELPQEFKIRKGKERV